MEEYKVLLTTSGVGSRLGHITDFTNKSLVRVGDKPSISHIVETYPINVTFVVTLGYFGSHVRDYLELAHPDRAFEFVEVEKFQGAKSSLLHSMKKAKDFLQAPFIFHVCDAIVDYKPAFPFENWIAGSAGDACSSTYRTLNVRNGTSLDSINEKGEIGFDLAYPGLVGISDYKLFWEKLEEIINDRPGDTQLSDCHVINAMLECDSQFKILYVNQWLDIGEPLTLASTRKKIQSSMEVLDKPHENIFILNGSVIKFFYDDKIVRKRVKRSEILSGLVPSVEASKKNFFKYGFVEGNLFAKSINTCTMKRFLDWAHLNMWSKGLGVDIRSECDAFYFDKTHRRAKAFLNGKDDVAIRINGENVDPIDTLMSALDRQMMIDGVSSIIHGDFILDNVVETKSGYTLIDWRQDFAGLLDVGDTYYDLAKLNHNLIFNHDIVNKGHYSIDYGDDGGITCDILVKKNMLDCQEVLHSFINENNYNLEKVELLTAIIWINMAPLHEYPLNKFLFNFGKYNLQRALNKGRRKDAIS